MKFMHLPLDTLFLRFYLMMAIVLIAGYSGLWVVAFLALPVFMSCLLGITFGTPKEVMQEGMFKEMDVMRERTDKVTKQTAA